MVQLLRIVGDVARSNTRLDGRFTVPVKVKPNSRLALQSLRLELSDTDSNQEFEVTSGTNTFTIDGELITLTPATYTLDGLRNEVRNQIPYQVATDFGGLGLSYDVALTNDRFQFTKAVQELDNSEFLDEWILVLGTPILGTGDFDANGSTDEVIISAPESFGNARFTFEGTLSTVDEFSVIADSDNEWLKLGVLAGNWVYSSADIVIGPANPGDKFKLAKAGDTIRYTVNGVNYEQTFSFADQQRLNNQTESNVWYIQAPAGSTAALTKCRDNNDDHTRNTDLELSFNSNRLARYFGFKANTPYVTSDKDPAIIESPKEPQGQSPGDILVCIDPFILDSYVADERSTRDQRGLNNVLYSVVNSDQTSVIDFDTGYPIPLNIKNAQETNISTLNVTFRNRVNGKLLTFVDNPVINMLVYAPGE